MEEYRKLHAQRFLERQQAKEAEERKAQEEQERRSQVCNDITRRLDEAASTISVTTSVLDIIDALHSMSYHLRETSEVWQADIQELVRAAVMNLLERINANTTIMISYTNEVDIQASREIQRTMKDMLRMCNILATEDEDLDMDIAMDCSMDEEIARRLAEEDQPRRRPLVVREPRRRKARRQDQEAGPSTATADLQEDPEPELPEPIKKKVVKKKVKPDNE